MSNIKTINACNISADEFNKVKISAMSDRPNAMSSYGGAKKNAADIKAAFDKPLKMLMDKHNKLVKVVSDKDSELNQNEDERKDAETARVNSENAREAAETDREEAEKAREAARQSFEEKVNATLVAQDEKVNEVHEAFKNNHLKGDKGDKGDTYIITEADKKEIADMSTEALQKEIGDITASLDAILAIQEELIGDGDPEPVPSEGLAFTAIDGGYEVSGIGECTDTDIVIPLSYNNLPVTSIGYSAFEDCTSLTNITIPDSVTSIGGYAFCGCSSLTSITIPDSVTSINMSTFISCSSLTSVTIPNSVTSIGYSAFMSCSSLTSITIPDSVTSIGDYTFMSCSSLTSITIPDSVTSIGSCAFNNCSSLASIVVDEENTVYHSAGNCLIETESKTLIGGCKNNVIPADGSVTSIGSYAFYECDSLTSIEIPNSVTSIGDDAFGDCDSLTSIEIPNSVTSIGSYAFEDCTSLTSITIPDSVTSIGDDAFAYCSSLTDIYVPWSEGEIEGAPWGATDATIHYNSYNSYNSEV